MDPISVWGLIIALITGAGSLSAMKAWQIIGRIEGKTDRIAERMDRQSGKIDEHERQLVLLPERVGDIEKELRRVDNIEHELRRIERKVDELLHRSEGG